MTNWNLTPAQMHADTLRSCIEKLHGKANAISQKGGEEGPIGALWFDRAAGCVRELLTAKLEAEDDAPQAMIVKVEINVAPGTTRSEVARAVVDRFKDFASASARSTVDHEVGATSGGGVAADTAPPGQRDTTAQLYERAVQPLQAILLEAQSLGTILDRLGVVDAPALASRAAIESEAQRLAGILRVVR